MPEATIPIVIVNHVAIDIAVTPDVLWHDIIDEYVEARKFRQTAVVTPFDDASTLLGGYRIRVEKDGAVVDDRICRITERDDGARRLSIAADYLMVVRGFLVYVTYQAWPTPGGSRFTLDCHTNMGFEAPAGGDKAALQANVAATKASFDAGLSSYLAGVKARLEAAP